MTFRRRDGCSSSSSTPSRPIREAERAMVRWLGRLSTEKGLEFSLAAQCVELVAALRGPDAGTASSTTSTTPTNGSVE